MNIENKMIGKIFKVLFFMIIMSENTVLQAASVSNLVTPVSYFVNHIKQLHELNQNLNKYKTSSVVGTSGIGKTQLVRNYAYSNKERYQVIWFIDCNFDLKQEFLKLAKAINSSVNKQVISEDLAKIEKEVINYLSTLEYWLLVFDNNKIETNAKLKNFIELESNGHMIFCSQDLLLLPHVIRVKEFLREDSEKLAESILKDGTFKEIDFLAKEFKGYPVLIVQGAQILNNIKGLSNSKYKKMIQETDNKIKFNVELCIKELSPNARELIKKIALINNQSFSKDFLRMLTNHKETFDDDIYQLSRFVLISNSRADDVNPFFEMHDVIAKNIQEISSLEENRKILEEIIFNISVKSFPKGALKRYIVRTSPTITENLEVILRNAETYNIELSKNLELRVELFATSVNNANYESSKEMIKWFEDREAKKMFNISKMSNHEKSVYSSYLNIMGGYNNSALSNPIKAMEYFIKAKDIIDTIDKSVVDDDQYMKFSIVYQLFKTQLDLRQLQTAQKTIEVATKIYELGLKNNNIEESEACYLYLGRARLLLAQGLYDQALEQINKTTVILEQLGMKESANQRYQLYFERVHQTKIDILNYLGKYEEAYSLSEWLYTILKPLVATNHQIIGNIRIQMARAQYGLKNYQTSIENTNKAIEILLKVRGIDVDKVQFTKDIQLAKAFMIKADSLSALEHIEESLSFYEKAEAIHNNIYVQNLSSSNSLKHILFEATMTACKKPSKSSEFWFKHFYGNLRSIFGSDVREVKEIKQICSPEIHNKYFQ